MDFDFDFDFEEWGGDFGSDETQTDATKPDTAERDTRRRKTECIEISTKTEHRRAFGEARLFEAMKGAPLLSGHSYHFITAGDVDSLSFLKFAMVHCGHIRHMLASTWCMAAEDVLQFDRWLCDGVIDKIDFYVGEIFPGSYSVEFAMLKKIIEKHDCGRIAVFRNHSKVYAIDAEKYKLAIETSANINTNPRTEQGVITVNDAIYDFYKAYFDGIKSFE